MSAWVCQIFLTLAFLRDTRWCPRCRHHIQIQLYPQEEGELILPVSLIQKETFPYSSSPCLFSSTVGQNCVMYFMLQAIAKQEVAVGLKKQMAIWRKEVTLARSELCDKGEWGNPDRLSNQQHLLWSLPRGPPSTLTVTKNVCGSLWGHEKTFLVAHRLSLPTKSKTLPTKRLSNFLS